MTKQLWVKLALAAGVAAEGATNTPRANSKK